MRIKSGIKKSNGHPAASEALRGIDSQRGRQNVTGLLENRRVRIKLALGPTEQRNTVGTNPAELAVGRNVRLDDRLQMIVKIFEWE